MKLDVYNQDASVIEQIQVSDIVFAMKTNPDLIHQVVVAQRANARQPWAHTKDRSEVRGGGKKPWKQKGTGRARHASIRSPIWKGGGVAFGPSKDRVYTQKINSKMKQKAFAMSLSSKLHDKHLLVLDMIDTQEMKTKKGNMIVDKISGVMDGYKKTKNKRDSILVVTPKSDPSVQKMLRNLPHVTVNTSANFNIVDILAHRYLVVLRDALPLIEKRVKLA